LKEKAVNYCDKIIYKRMKKIILIFCFCLATAGTSFAQSHVEMMRFLTITTLLQYGHQLYERGDYRQAGAVYEHVLTYDNHQPQALEYLKDMGFPAPEPDPVIEEKQAVQALGAVNINDTESLKKAIEAEKRVVGTLQSQVTTMRAKMAAQSSQEQTTKGGL
jgi:hypothetical protein